MNYNPPLGQGDLRNLREQAIPEEARNRRDDILHALHRLDHAGGTWDLEELERLIRDTLNWYEIGLLHEQALQENARR